MIINQIIDKKMQIYPTNLTENQWKVIENILNDNRKFKHDLNFFFNAIFYFLKTGCQLRMLPTHFAPWNTIYYYHRQWKNNSLIEEIHEVLRNMVHKIAGHKEFPGAVCIDSRSVKTSRSGGVSRRVDGGRKVKGHKQHIITDTISSS